MASNSSDVSKTAPIYDDQTLGDIKSFSDALAVLETAGVAITDITDYGDGFAVVAKDALVKVPFVILDYKFADGDYGENFTIIRAVTKFDQKVIITDGGTGIRKQVEDLDRRGVVGGVLVPNGLTVSEYSYTDEKTGEVTPAKTYYFAM